MRRIPFVIIALALLAGTAPSIAQEPGSPGGEVTGRVVDADGEPLAGTSVAIWSPAHDAIVTGAVAREDGTFRVENVPAGTYVARVNSIGYVDHESETFTIGPGARTEDLGTIRLGTSLVEAEAIDVELERPTITIEPDRNTYLARDVAPAAVNASEVLENVPSVQVDSEGKVSLRGNENVAVHVNGRPAPVQGEQLASYMQTLPADAIDRVEVIPVPSARHDPEGMAGIINIVMRENTDLGTSGGFTVGAAGEDRYNLGGSLGYQRGRFTSYTTYGYNEDERDFIGVNDRERLNALGNTLSLTEQDLIGDGLRQGHNLTTTLDTEFGERDVLTNALTVNHRTFDNRTFAAYTEIDASGEVIDRFARPRESDESSFLIDYTLAHKRTWEPRAHEVSTEIRFNRSDETEETLLWRHPPGEPALRTEIEDHDDDAIERELTAQIDYVRALGEATKLEAGYKGEAERVERDFVLLNDDLGTGDVTRSDLSNAFVYDERVHAIYGVLSRSVGKWELQGGLRAEVADQDFALTDETFPHEYASLFPSGIAVYNASEATQFKLGYSRRINRPGTWELNPFPRFFDTQNVFIGNPELDPEYTDAIELGYTRSGERGSLQISPFYRHTTDVIRFIVDTDDVVNGREVTSINFENLATSDSYGADVNGSLEIGEWFDGFASFNVFKQVTDGGSATSLASDAVTWSTRLNGTFQLTPALSLQAMTFYRAPVEFETAEFSSFKMSSLTLRQKLLDDRASLSLRVFDPFDVMAFRVEAGDENLVQLTDRDIDAREVQLTFQYNFGKRPEVRRPQSDGGQDSPGGFPQ